MGTGSAQTANSIFISYRIADTLPVADRLAAELQRTFGAEQVFFDRRTIEPGGAWDRDIQTAAKGASVVLVVIGRKWLTEQDKYGIRRLDVPGDWVRREVETALAGEGLVIPVLVDGASAPPAEAFAGIPSIAGLSRCQGTPLRTRDWDKDLATLVERLGTTGLPTLSAAEAKQAIIPGRIATRGSKPFVGRNAELDRLGELLTPIDTTRIVVVRGKPGVGKSEVAREYARQHQADYANGAFFIGMEQGGIPVDLAKYGGRNLGLDTAGLKIEEQCTLVLRNLIAPTLLIYDNVGDPNAVLPWLPADDEGTHVVITTTWEAWDGWTQVEVKALDDEHALEVVEALGGAQVAKRYGAQLVAKSGGLPVQLCPATRSVAKALRRHGEVRIALADETQASFAAVWERLEPDGRLLLAAASFFNPDRIRADLLRTHLTAAAGWSAATVDAAIDACLDQSLLDPGDEELRMHRLQREYVHSATGVDQDALVQFRDAHAVAFAASAQAVSDDPANNALVADLLCYPPAPGYWSYADHPLTLSETDCYRIGDGLSDIGLFGDARPWFERAVAEEEKGDDQGHVNHESLGSSLYQVGNCLSESGNYDDARDWFERAVAEAKRANTRGRANYENLCHSLLSVGNCFYHSGDYEGARPWLEQAVEETEKGDNEGRINHESLSVSLHQIGACLYRMGDYEGAVTWSQRAVRETEMGDIDRRVDHESLSRSLQQLGACLYEQGDYEGAKRWYEQAVEEAEKGDIHERVDHEGVGSSQHLVGECLQQTGDYQGARRWFEQAITEKGKGDIYGRVDHESLGASLQQVGDCITETGDYDGARPWFEQAVTEKEKGDIHGRVDHANLGASLALSASCLLQTGDLDGARSLLERALEETEKGDMHGHVDHSSITLISDMLNGLRDASAH